MVPPIAMQSKIDEQEEFSSGLRLEKFKIEEFLQLEVIYDDDYYSKLNKQIQDYTAISADEQTITFNVQFTKPSDITTDINNPDYLKVQFLVPELIVNA